jgi:hypothetical protein
LGGFNYDAENKNEKDYGIG